ncbi:unnamed protein product [Sphenostylis stenocarpa]|uniref:Uncharacterized protein n=1 Tax=Sphenostylis stenocarpa TaxID=92480 RepID=A0AA86VIY3_9FABA|nr:unnamed protein product [Sphenostylis stenocarpa]
MKARESRRCGTMNLKRPFLLFPVPMRALNGRATTDSRYYTSYCLWNIEFQSKHALNPQCKDQEKDLVTYLMKQNCQIALVK